MANKKKKLTLDELLDQSVVENKDGSIDIAAGEGVPPKEEVEKALKLAKEIILGKSYGLVIVAGPRRHKGKLYPMAVFEKRSSLDSVQYAKVILQLVRKNAEKDGVIPKNFDIDQWFKDHYKDQ